MNKKYKIKKTLKLINKLQPFVTKYLTLQNDYYVKLNLINKEMAKITKIKDIEICEYETGWGIGNVSRTMELIHDSELIEKKIMDLNTN